MGMAQLGKLFLLTEIIQIQIATIPESSEPNSLFP